MFLDTSGLLCVFDKREAHHARASSLFFHSGERLTHSYVMAEFVALARARGVPRLVALDSMTELMNNPSVVVVYVDEGLHEEALGLLRRRLDKDWSLCDAVSFLLMSDHGFVDALTTDHHFEQAGFVRLLRP